MMQTVIIPMDSNGREMTGPEQLHVLGVVILCILGAAAGIWILKGLSSLIEEYLDFDELEVFLFLFVLILLVSGIFLVVKY